MRAGDVAYLRSSDEPVTVVAVLDAAGTLLVRVEGEEPFEARRDELMSVHEKLSSCGCC